MRYSSARSSNRVTPDVQDDQDADDDDDDEFEVITPPLPSPVQANSLKSRVTRIIRVKLSTLGILAGGLAGGVNDHDDVVGDEKKTLMAAAFAAKDVAISLSDGEQQWNGLRASIGDVTVTDAKQVMIVALIHETSSDRSKTDFSVSSVNEYSSRNVTEYSADNEYSAQENTYCKNEGKIYTMVFWGCSCNVQVVAYGQDLCAA
jgi:hypothetical protein